MRLSGLQVHIYIHSILNMVFHKLTKAITQKIHVQCFTECQFIVFEYIIPFYFHRTYFKGFMIYVPHLFHSYIDRKSSILSILTKLIVSCSFVTAAKFVIVKINAARKVACGSISDLESSAHVPSFKRDLSHFLIVQVTVHQQPW